MGLLYHETGKRAKAFLLRGGHSTKMGCMKGCMSACVFNREKAFVCYTEGDFCITFCFGNKNKGLKHISITSIKFHLANLTCKNRRQENTLISGACLVALCYLTQCPVCVLSFCRNHDTLAHMTTPKEMLSNVMQALRYLDSRLPNGSHVILTGLVDGRFLWDNLHDRYHPLGKYEMLQSSLSYLPARVSFSP